MLKLTASFVHKASADMPLNHVPMLASHDAATGYMGTADVRATWMQTQWTSLPTQATCGSRALDLRLGAINGTAKFHHGSFYLSQQTVEGSMADMVNWAAAHPSELVLLMGSHCQCCKSYSSITTEGVDCSGCSCASDTFTKPFSNNGIHVLTDCGQVLVTHLFSQVSLPALGIRPRNHILAHTTPHRPNHSTQPLHPTPSHSAPIISTPLHSTPLHSTLLHPTPRHPISPHLISGGIADARVSAQQLSAAARRAPAHHHGVCFVPYRTVPHLTPPYRTAPYRFAPYLAFPYRTLPYRTLPYRAVPYRAVRYLLLSPGYWLLPTFYLLQLR